MITLRGWIALGIIAIVLLGVGTCTYQKYRADRAEARLAPAKASVEALDKVATETPIIRDNQKADEHAVSQIPGADDKLPADFGRDLQRVRDKSSNRNP